jgi:hypothetical protein
MPEITKYSVETIEWLGDEAEKAESQGDFQKAETQYLLAISLYQESFPDAHYAGLHCIRKYLEFLQHQNREEDLRRELERAGNFVRKFAESLALD